MDILKIFFPVSGVETYIFYPPLVSFVLSFFCSMSGVSGAFLLLPFQMTVLNFTSPAVSSTNFVYNIVAIPSGVYRYIKEKRMAWSLAIVMTMGTIPGLLIGYSIRIRLLPDPRAFKLFVGSVLLYIGSRLLYNVFLQQDKNRIDMKFKESKSEQKKGLTPGLTTSAVMKTISISLTRTEYEFWGERFSFNTSILFMFSFCVGIIGGAYGIGGGAIIAPFCVTFFHLPVYTIAGATLFGTFLSSVIGILIYSLVPLQGGVTTPPDWLLGILFGAGGFAGIYLGARCQKYVPQKAIKLLLGLLILIVAAKYISQFFR